MIIRTGRRDSAPSKRDAYVRSGSFLAIELDRINLVDADADSRSGRATTHAKKKEKKQRNGNGEKIRRHGPEARNSGSVADADENKTATYLNIKMKSTKREKNTATLSMVRSITKSWRRRLGRNRTSFRILRRRKVRRTLKPELPLRSSTTDWQSSTTL